MVGNHGVGCDTSGGWEREPRCLRNKLMFSKVDESKETAYAKVLR